jgi:hypothetical protein
MKPLGGVELDPRPRERGGRRCQVGERDASPARRGGLHAGGHAPRPDRGTTAVERLRGPAEVDHDGQRLAGRTARAPAGRLHEEVEQDGLGIEAGHEQVAARAEAGQQRLAGERGEHRAQRGVDGVAARPQDLCAGLRGPRMAGGDDTAGHGRATCGA